MGKVPDITEMHWSDLRNFTVWVGVESLHVTCNECDKRATIHGYKVSALAIADACKAHDCDQRQSKWTPSKPEHNPRHDYERGTTRHPMYTEPMCGVCGLTKNNPIHSERRFGTEYEEDGRTPKGAIEL